MGSIEQSQSSIFLQIEMTTRKNAKHMSVLDLQIRDSKSNSSKKMKQIQSISHKVVHCFLPSLSSNKIARSKNHHSSLLDCLAEPVQGSSNNSILQCNLPEKADETSQKLRIPNIKKQNKAHRKSLSKLQLHNRFSDSKCERNIIEESNEHQNHVHIMFKQNQLKQKNPIARRKKLMNPDRLSALRNKKWKSYNLFQTNDQREDLNFLHDKMLHNKFDQNLSAFLLDKKMRIPCFMNKLR